MLSTLYIENIAVIEKTNIEFRSGLNVLTGETGAGKSIVIDAINAILGKRTPKEIIRTGAQSAFVSATFEAVGKQAEEKIQQLGYTLEDSLLIIQRELHTGGRNTCRINGRPAPVSILKELAPLLINIHGQNESHELTAVERHINYIDSLSGNQALLADYGTAFGEYKVLKKQLDNMNTDDALRMQKIDLLKYQVNELAAADLQPGETDALEEQRQILANSEKISDSVTRAQIALFGDETITGAVEGLETAAEQLSVAARYMTDLEELSSRMYDIAYNLKDCGEDISHYANQVEYDPRRLDEIEQRLDLIYKLSRKYGDTVEAMLAFLETARQELNQLEQYDTNREALTQKAGQAYHNAEKLAKELSQSRKQAIAAFQRQVQQELSFLDMPKVEVAVSQEKTDLNEKGCDKIEILISANPGEPPKPVSKIASGGELSRMMLAIKTVLSKTDTVDTLIFDEIDTGISGSAAHKVGQKLKGLSVENQVICVTHQSQIAAFADNHYLIKKEFAENKTYTSVTPLDFEGRKQELARIISGSQINRSALEYAGEMLTNANNT